MSLFKFLGCCMLHQGLFRFISIMLKTIKQNRMLRYIIFYSQAWSSQWPILWATESSQEFRGHRLSWFWIHKEGRIFHVRWIFNELTTIIRTGVASMRQVCRALRNTRLLIDLSSKALQQHVKHQLLPHKIWGKVSQHITSTSKNSKSWPWN